MLLLQHIYLLISCNCVWSKWFTAVLQCKWIVVRWALGISTTTSATNRLMLLVAKQMEYLNREVLRIQRKAGIAVQICLWSRGRWVPQGWRNNLAGISNIIQYHPISMKWCLIFFHFLSFWSCYMRLYASTVVSSLFISHITNVSLDMNDFFHINTYEWNIWMHRSICFQKTLYFNKQADMKGPLKAWNTWPCLVLGLHGSCHDVVDRCDAALTEQHSLQTAWTWSTPSVPH